MRVEPSAAIRWDRTVLGTVVLLIFLLATDILPVVFGPGGITTVLKMLITAAMLGIVALYRQRFVRGVFAAPELVAFVALAVLTLAWSIDRGRTMDALIPLITTTMLAITVAGMASFRTLIVMLGCLSAMIAIASIMAVPIFPGAGGEEPWPDAWRGIFNHKNGLGSASAIGLVLTCSAAAVTSGRMRTFMIVIIGLLLFTLIMAHSRTAQMVTIFSLTALGAGLIFWRTPLLWAVAYLFIVFVVFVGVYVLFRIGATDGLFEAMDRRPTMSGRIPLWERVWPHVQERLMLGYGYVAFWDSDSARVIQISRDPTLRFIPHYSHSGLLETLLNVGLVGLLLLCAAVFRAVAAVFVGLRDNGDRRLFVIGLVIVVTFLLLNILENSILSRHSIQWMVFVIVVTKVGLVARSMNWGNEPRGAVRSRPHRLPPAMISGRHGAA